MRRLSKAFLVLLMKGFKKILIRVFWATVTRICRLYQNVVSRRTYNQSPTDRSINDRQRKVYTPIGYLSMRRGMIGGLVFRKGQSTNVTTRLKGARIHKAQVNRLAIISLYYRSPGLTTTKVDDCKAHNCPMTKVRCKSRSMIVGRSSAIVMPFPWREREPNEQW